MCALQRSYLEYFSIRKKVIVLLSHCIRFVGDAQRAFGAGHDKGAAGHDKGAAGNDRSKLVREYGHVVALEKQARHP